MMILNWENYFAIVFLSLKGSSPNAPRLEDAAASTGAFRDTHGKEGCMPQSARIQNRAMALGTLRREKRFTPLKTRRDNPRLPHFRHRGFSVLERRPLPQSHPLNEAGPRQRFTALKKYPMVRTAKSSSAEGAHTPRTCDPLSRDAFETPPPSPSSTPHGRCKSTSRRCRTCAQA